MPAAPKPDRRRWEEGIVRSEELTFHEFSDPFGDEHLNVPANRKERRDETLACLRPDVVRVLVDSSPLEVDVTDEHRSDGIVSGATQNGEGDQGSISPLDERFDGHGRENMPNLLDSRGGALANRFGDALIVDLLLEPTLESARLLDMELPEVAPSGALFELHDGSGYLIHGRL
jgi:hypothetical protein